MGKNLFSKMNPKELEQIKLKLLGVNSPYPNS